MYGTVDSFWGGGSMKKILLAAALLIGVVASQLVTMSQARAEMVSVPGTEYCILTETLQYDPAPTYLGKPIVNGYEISVKCTREDINRTIGKRLLFLYKFSRATYEIRNTRRERTWGFSTDDENQVPRPVAEDWKISMHVHQNPTVSKIFLKVLDYLPAEDAAQIRAELAQQEKDFSARENTRSNSSIGNLPDAAKLAELKQAAEPFVTQADAKFKAKDYTAAKELFSQAIEKNPYDYHTHDLYARSMYREKSKDKNYDLIISEMKTAINLAPDNKSKADCYGFLAKVYRKLAMDNLFNMDNKIDYTALAQECDKKELALHR